MVRLRCGKQKRSLLAADKVAEMALRRLLPARQRSQAVGKAFFAFFASARAQADAVPCTGRLIRPNPSLAEPEEPPSRAESGQCEQTTFGGAESRVGVVSRLLNWVGGLPTRTRRLVCIYKKSRPPQLLSCPSALVGFSCAFPSTASLPASASASASASVRACAW